MLTATYRFNKTIVTATIKFIVTVAIVVYKGLIPIVYHPIKILRSYKIRADFICEVSPFSLDFSRQTIKSNHGKSTHFSGQPPYCQVIKFLDKSTILRLSREYGEEHYVKRFDIWTHLVVMLYTVIMRFDSLREIMASLQVESRKLCHLGIRLMPSRSTLSDANRPWGVIPRPAKRKEI